MSVTQPRPVVPGELPKILHDLSYAVIKNNPPDIISFAADYFQQLLNERDKDQENTEIDSGEEGDEEIVEVENVEETVENAEETVENAEEDDEETKDSAEETIDRIAEEAIMKAEEIIENAEEAIEKAEETIADAEETLEGAEETSEGPEESVGGSAGETVGESTVETIETEDPPDLSE